MKKQGRAIGGSLVVGSLCTIVGWSGWNLLLCVCSAVAGAQRESPPPLGGGRERWECRGGEAKVMKNQNLH